MTVLITFNEDLSHFFFSSFEYASYHFSLILLFCCRDQAKVKLVSMMKKNKRKLKISNLLPSNSNSNSYSNLNRARSKRSKKFEAKKLFNAGFGRYFEMTATVSQSVVEQSCPWLVEQEVLKTLCPKKLG